MKPLGDYPLHIVVNHGTTMLLGVVNTERDKDHRWRPGA